ncbi:MAG: nucleotidyltransferase family protein [Clostridia bacterium]|nr:nucleotidyltransferase family protein [Clostridia bacterium]
MNMKIGAVLLAAGRSERFGSDKLLADFGGRPMICRALEAMRALPAARKCVVAGSDNVAVLAGEYGFAVIRNHEPQLGQSHSIRLGVLAMEDLDAVLLMVGDQPRLTRSSLARLAEAFGASEKGIACLRDETHMGNPAIFAKTYFQQLLALSGDRGAKGILKAHPDDLLVVPCVHRGELADADTPQELETMESAQNE